MNRTITVKGVGHASVSPDYITISMMIESVHKDYNEATEDAARRIGELLDAVICCGYKKEDLKTISFRVDTNYERMQERSGYYKSVFSGYKVSHRLKLSFDMDSRQLAKVLAAIADSGAEPELSIAFTVKDPSKVSEILLINATENAAAKAAILCKASGNALGQLLSIGYNWSELKVTSETDWFCDIIQPLMAESESSMPDIEPDDINVSDTVTFTWEIK